MKTGYSEASKQGDTISFRIRPDQKVKLEEYAELYKSSISVILREAITVWLNLNSKKGDN